MDHSEGVQIPQGILPQVSVLKPGIALCLKHSQVDKRYVDGHIELLSETLPSALYPAFMARDTSTGQLDHVLENLERSRQEALKNNRVFFIFSPYFAPRAAALMSAVDHVFFYSPGLSAPFVYAEKINGWNLHLLSKEMMVLSRRQRSSSERKMLQVKLPEGVSPEEASRILGDALAAHFSGSIDIEQVSTHAQQ